LDAEEGDGIRPILGLRLEGLGILDGILGLKLDLTFSKRELTVPCCIRSCRAVASFLCDLLLLLCSLLYFYSDISQMRDIVAMKNKSDYVLGFRRKIMLILASQKIIMSRSWK